MTKNATLLLMLLSLVLGTLIVLNTAESAQAMAGSCTAYCMGYGQACTCDGDDCTCTSSSCEDNAAECKCFGMSGSCFSGTTCPSPPPSHCVGEG